MTQEEYINQHPELFKDGIDKWLFLEFGILGGCCSAEKSHEYYIARMVAEKLTDAFIEKVEKWLKENKNHPFIGCEDPCLSGYLTDEFIEDFRKTIGG